MCDCVECRRIESSSCRIKCTRCVISRLGDDKKKEEEDEEDEEGEEREKKMGIQVPSRGKKTQTQTRRHAIRNRSSLVRKVSQPTKITLEGARLSVAVEN